MYVVPAQVSIQKFSLYTLHNDYHISYHSYAQHVCLIGIDCSLSGITTFE